jgi:hypothetical protein
MPTSTMPAPTPGAPAALFPLMRRLLYVAAALVLLAGIPLFVFPQQTDRYFAWTVDARMTAVFLGAAYWSAIGLEVGAARAATWSRARIAVPAVFVFTSLTLVVSLVHLHKLHFQHHVPVSALVVASAWLTIYVLVPVIMAVGWVAQHRHSTSVPPPSGLPVAARVTLLVLATLLLGIGVAMLAAPGWAYDAWPWALTPITRGAVAAWLIGLGVAAGHAWLINDKPSLRPLGLTGVAFGVLQAVALARYGSELDWGSFSAIVYVAILVALTAVSGWALLPLAVEGHVDSSGGVVSRAATTSPHGRADMTHRPVAAARGDRPPLDRPVRAATTRSDT